MPQPTLSDVHVNALLSNLSNMYAQEEDYFVARKVFPIIPVSNISDRYVVYSRADFNRNQMRKRAPGGLVANAGYRNDNTPSYLCDVWALGKTIDDQVRGNADAIYNLDAEATRFLTVQSLINREIAWASVFFTTSVWTNSWSGGSANSSTGYPTAPASSTSSSYTALKWSDPNSTPIQDIRTLKRIVQLTTTFRPNKMVLSRPVFDVLCDHPDFIDRVKYGGTNERPAKIALQALASVFEMDEVLVMDAIYNTAGEQAGIDSGATYAPPTYNSGVNAAESNSFIAGNHVWIGYTPSAPGIMTPGCGYTFAWNGYFGATQAGERMSSYYFQPDRSTHVEIESAYVHKLVSADMGGFIANIV
jgi:hypothetical protein